MLGCGEIELVVGPNGDPYQFGRCLIQKIEGEALIIEGEKRCCFAR